MYFSFFKKINKGIIGRRNSFSLLKSSFSKDDKIIHVHCSSYGEYLMSENLIKKLKNKFEDHKILLSFISPSGFENVKKTNLNVLYIYQLTQAITVKNFMK